MNVPKDKLSKREDVRNKILDAAKRLFVDEGFQATSIRKIASKVGCSPTTIYLYYKDKNDIVYALHKEGFNLLKVQLISLINVESPFERLKALGRTYINFSKNNSAYYEVMFMLKEPMDYLYASSKNENWEEGAQVFEFLVATVTECQREGYFPGGKPEFLALQAWSMVHGLCSLYITTRLKIVGEECISSASETAMLESTFESYINLIEGSKQNIINTVKK